MDELYQEIILESSRSEANRGDLEHIADAKHELVFNPLCGDNIDLWIVVTDGKIQEVKFSGQGCAISQASASLMSDLIRGKSVDELAAVVTDFQTLLNSEPDEDCRDRLGQLVALEGVKKFPVRMRCAMLSFEALKRLLKSMKESP